MKLTIKLSEEEITNILKEHLATKGYQIDPNNIEYCLETRYYGYENGYSETVFNGVIMNCEIEE